MVTTPTIPPPSSPARPGDHAPDIRTERAPRPLGRRPSLPAGRAIVGGLLVTIAAVGTFAAYANATAGPTSTFVIAAKPLRAGQRVEAGDLRAVAMDLPGGVGQQAFSSLRDLEGATALAPIDADQLIAPASVRLPGSGGPAAVTHEFSFALEREKALGGRLQRGELVDAVATYGTGSDAYSRIVIRRARVIDVDTGARGTVGSSGKVTIALALDTDHQVLEAMHAVEVAKVTLVRTTGDGDPAGAAADTYRPATPTDADGAPTGGGGGTGTRSSSAAGGPPAGPARSSGASTTIPADGPSAPAAGTTPGAGT